MIPTPRSAPRSPSSSALRGALICYGIAGYALLVPASAGVGQTLIWTVGVVLQLAIVSVRRFVPAIAVPVLELIADGVTVALFAFGTLRGISAGLDF